MAFGVAAFAGAFAAFLPQGCDEGIGVPSWERCWTLLGTPALSLTGWGLDNQLDILIPLAIGVFAGGVTWWLLRLRREA